MKLRPSEVPVRCGCVVVECTVYTRNPLLFSGLLHPQLSNRHYKLFGKIRKNLSRARNLVARLDAATAIPRSRHLHGCTQHTVASATV